MASIPSSEVMKWCHSEWSLAQCCTSNHSLLMELQCASHLHCYQVMRPFKSINFNISPSQALDVDFLRTATKITKQVIKNSSLVNLMVINTIGWMLHDKYCNFQNTDKLSHWTLKYLTSTTAYQAIH